MVKTICRYKVFISIMYYNKRSTSRGNDNVQPHDKEKIEQYFKNIASSCLHKFLVGKKVPFDKNVVAIIKNK